MAHVRTGACFVFSILPFSAQCWFTYPMLSLSLFIGWIQLSELNNVFWSFQVTRCWEVMFGSKILDFELDCHIWRCWLVSCIDCGTHHWIFDKHSSHFPLAFPFLLTELRFCWRGGHGRDCPTTSNESWWTHCLRPSEQCFAFLIKTKDDGYSPFPLLLTLMQTRCLELQQLPCNNEVMNKDNRAECEEEV